MHCWKLLLCGVLLAAVAFGENGSSTSLADDERESFKLFAARIAEALGVFEDITVFEQDDTGSWHLVAGQYVPVTVHDTVPARYEQDMRSDRPMMLPTRVQGFQGGDGQSSPYSVVGRMPGSNPEVQWVFVVRQYSIKDTTDADFPDSGDMAVIGHHPRTGATAFLQFYRPSDPKSGVVVVSPFSDRGPEFWSPVDTIADSFQCQRCHGAGPFIHTPWINQVRVRRTGPGEAPAEPMVPSDPLGPYFFVYADSARGEPFAGWNKALRHLNKPENKCTACHRVALDLIGLNENSTRYAGLPSGARNRYSVLSDSFQTSEYETLHWMPPVASPPAGFYDGQRVVADSWEATYGASAAEVNRLDSTSVLDPIPRPPREYQTILVDRPQQDQVAPRESVWLVDTRMRANSDGDLEQWRFYGKGPASNGVLAAPVVYRRTPNDGSKIEFEVVFVGEARGHESAEEWVPAGADGRTFPTRQGDYFGLVFTNTGSESGAAAIPYTVDEWAKIKGADGTTLYPNGTGAWHGYVTLRLASEEAPAVGTQFVFGDAEYRTYSFELRNRL